MPDSAASAVRDWRDLVSSRVGVIRSVDPQVRGPEEPQPPWLYLATLSNFDFKKIDQQERVAAGKGRSDEEAQLAAVGEALERYCASHWDPRRTFTEKLGALPAAISPAECVLYSEPQYAQPGWPYRRWTPQSEVTWINGTELPGGRAVALPASLVYLVHPPPRAEDLFTPATSNGLAAGPDLAAAVYAGLCELMERDAFLIAWMNRMPAADIDLEHSGRYAPVIARHYADFGLQLRAFRIPSDLPASVVMAAGFDADPKRPAVVVGMGCHLDPDIAVDKAVFEYCQGRPSEARRFAANPPGRLRSYADVKTLDDHPAFFSDRDRLRELEFLWSTGETVRASDLANPSRGNAERDLEFCAAALAELGHRVAYVDLTTEDVAPYPFRIVRTIATGLQPIHFGHGQERLGGRRLFELPYRLGFASAPRTEADLNPCPHPLA